MGFKIDSRYSASIVRLADMIELALAQPVPTMDDAAFSKLDSVKANNRIERDRLIKRGHGLLNSDSFVGEACQLVAERRRHRKELAIQRREARARREAEKQAALVLIAA